MRQRSPHLLQGRLVARPLPLTGTWEWGRMVSLVTSLTHTVEDKIVTEDPIRSRAGFGS